MNNWVSTLEECGGESQAIQQVISLKALLERNEDSSVGALRKILVCPPPPPVPPQNVVAHVASNSCNSVKETVLGDDPLKTAPVVGMCCEGGDKDKTTLSPRSRCETNELGGQMTIFYCGKINVYGVPLAKLVGLLPMHPNMGLRARAIMHLADSPIDFTRDNLRNGNAALRSLLGHLQAAGDKNDVASTTMSSNSHTMQTEKMIEYQQPYMEKGNISSDSDIDGLMNRKVSLQRYLEKRKDRGRFFKGRKTAGQTSSSLEVCLSHQIGTHYSNGQSSQSGTNPSTLSRVPHAFCTLADNNAKLVNLCVDLNYESDQKH